MIRVLMATCGVLAAVCIFEGMALRRLKADLAHVDARAYRAALVDLHDRRDEVLRMLAWLDAYTRTDEGLGQREGLCKGGTPDLGAIGTWAFDVYLRERVSGASEIEARQRVVDAIQKARVRSDGQVGRGRFGFREPLPPPITATDAPAMLSSSRGHRELARLDIEVRAQRQREPVRIHRTQHQETRGAEISMDFAPEEVGHDRNRVERHLKAMACEPSSGFTVAVERTVILPKRREASPADRLKDDVRPFVGRLQQVLAPGFQQPPDLLQMPVGVGNVLEDVEAQDEIEGLVREIELVAAHLFERQIAVQPPAFVDHPLIDLGADDIVAEAAQMIEEPSFPAADLEDPDAGRENARLPQEQQVRVEVAELVALFECPPDLSGADIDRH